MILNVLLIGAGLLCLIATGVFLIELFRAPLGVEDENGCRLIETHGPVRPDNFESAGASGYAHPTPHAPLSAL